MARSTRSGAVFGTYVHGLFDSMAFAAGLVDRLRTRRGLPPLETRGLGGTPRRAADRYGALANLLREHLDLKPVWEALGLPPERDRRESSPPLWESLALPAGFALDLLLGDPRGWPHPVRADRLADPAIGAGRRGRSERDGGNTSAAWCCSSS